MNAISMILSRPTTRSVFTSLRRRAPDWTNLGVKLRDAYREPLVLKPGEVPADLIARVEAVGTAEPTTAFRPS